MNIDNLEVGQVYKNYKELCNVLDEKVKSGDSKRYQMIDWERYFEWKKEGNKFIITKVYDESLDKTVKRGGNNILPFIDEMELLMIDLLIEAKDNQLTVSNSKLLVLLSLVNPNYLKFIKDKNKLSNLVDMDIGYIIDFYDVTTSTFKSAINTVTKRLESKKLIIHEEVLMVCEVVSNTDLVYRESTKEEKELIIKIQNYILKEKYNCNDMQELFLKGLATSYYNDVSKVLTSTMNIKNAYKANRITFNSDNLKKELFQLLIKYDIGELESIINQKVMIRLHETNVKRYNKALEKLLLTDDSSNRMVLRSDILYIDNLDFLSSNLIDINNVDGIIENENIEFDF